MLFERSGGEGTYKSARSLRRHILEACVSAQCLRSHEYFLSRILYIIPVLEKVA